MFDERNLGIIQNLAGLPDWYVTDDANKIINLIIPFVYGAAGIILLVNVVTSGFKIMNSQGEPKAMQEAQVKLKNSAIGLLILFTSIWIVQLLLQFFGIDLTLFS